MAVDGAVDGWLWLWPGLGSGELLRHIASVKPNLFVDLTGMDMPGFVRKVALHEEVSAKYVNLW